jgi:hypothetical protein
MTKEELEIYQDGLNAGYRIEKYEGVTSRPINPYVKGTKEYAIWNNGFDEGTEDFIAIQNA